MVIKLVMESMQDIRLDSKNKTLLLNPDTAEQLQIQVDCQDIFP